MEIPTSEQLIADEQQYVAQTYKRAPFVLAHGEGVHLIDADGKVYTDWVAGIAVNALGYSDQELTMAIQKAAANGVIHTSNLYYSAPQIELAKALVEKTSFADRVFFTNSGTEANEGAIKFARKVAYEKGKTEKCEIVCFSGAFHGRTMGSLALTPREKYQKPFQPLMPGVVVAEYNNLDSAKAAISDKTAAIILEPVQGEGGIHVATDEFLRGLRELCNQHDALMIYDEVQCGMGRTGKLWAYEHSGVAPDMLTAAKPLAGGLPIGVILMTETVASAMHAGEHGTTFAGGPLVTSAAQLVLKRVSQPEFLAQVQEVGTYLVERLSEINSPLVKEVRGRGLMVGMELTIDAGKVVEAGYQHGLILVNAGPNVIRFVPPLIVEKQHVDELAEKLTTILAGLG
ncbi:MAG TPA: aspartate aminotransferase family protein [Phototrophicaceae bacterium]|nr:aspartate aminotransferase family protein [Phototrophicaceae bacterium]